MDAGPELGRGGERLRGELAALAGPAAGEAGPRLLKPNRTKFVTAAGEELVTRKPHVFEGDLHDAELRGRTRHFRRLFDDRGRLAAGLAALAPHLRLVPGEEGVAIKVRVGAGRARVRLRLTRCCPLCSRCNSTRGMAVAFPCTTTTLPGRTAGSS